MEDIEGVDLHTISKVSLQVFALKNAAEHYSSVDCFMWMDGDLRFISSPSVVHEWMKAKGYFFATNMEKLCKATFLL